MCTHREITTEFAGLRAVRVVVPPRRGARALPLRELVDVPVVGGAGGGETPK